jgi:hypothetical protein
MLIGLPRAARVRFKFKEADLVGTDFGLLEREPISINIPDSNSISKCSWEIDKKKLEPFKLFFYWNNPKKVLEIKCTSFAVR